jgi:hypothetical protein
VSARNFPIPRRAVGVLLVLVVGAGSGVFLPSLRDEPDVAALSSTATVATVSGAVAEAVIATTTTSSLSSSSSVVLQSVIESIGGSLRGP